jgi:hypothetical protein
MPEAGQRPATKSVDLKPYSDRAGHREVHFPAGTDGTIVAAAQVDCYVSLSAGSANRVTDMPLDAPTCHPLHWAISLRRVAAEDATIPRD